MRDRTASALILDLVSFADEMLPRAHRAGAEIRNRLDGFIDAVEHAPANKGQFFHASRGLLLALSQVNFHREGGRAERHDAAQWEMVSGMFLPMARIDAGRALEYERDEANSRD